MSPTRRPVRIALIAVAAVMVLGVGVGVVLVARFEPNTYKPRIVEAVRRATGRDLVLNGTVTLKPSLWPTIQVGDVAFPNPPGFSRPQMATLQGLELQLALLPLLSRRIEVDRLVLIHPDILLETDATGHPNWRMTPEDSPSVSAGSQAPVKSNTAKTALSIDVIRIQDGMLAYRDDKTGKVTTLGLPKLEIDAASPDSPLHVAADASYNGNAFNLVADTGSLNRLRDPAATAPLPVDVTFQALGAIISVKGTVANAQAMTGATIALAAKIPDLSALSPLASSPLPAVKQIVFKATLTDAAGGFHRGVMLHDLSLSSAGGDLSGDAAIGFGARPSVTAHLKSSRGDLDALQAAIDGVPAAASSPPGAKPAPPERDIERLFSDQPLPFDLLRSTDADLKLEIADLHTGGADYKAIAAHAVLKDGKLSVDPFAADLPGGHLSGTLSADAAQPAPPVRITMHAPGLAVQTLLAAIHQPSYASGNLEVYADLHGTGDSPHAIASSLDGSLGIAMASGTIDSHLLGSLLGNVMDTLNALNLVGKGNTTELKCFGMRMDAQNGIGAIKALALSSSLLTMTGGGTVNLGEETLSLQLRPQARVAGTGMVIPLNVSGPIRSPAVKVNEFRTAGASAGAMIGNATPMGIVGGLLSGDKSQGGGATDICTPALAAARGQAVPEAAPAALAGSNSTGLNPRGSNPTAALRNMFR